MENDLIRRSDALKCGCWEEWKDDDGWEASYVIYTEDIEAIPAVDAVEVVRCKDCKSWLRFFVPMVGNCSKHCETTDGDDYCSYGERRADDGK